MSTLLGRDRHPGEIPGWGPVPAEVARTVVAAQRAAEWHFALTDPAGQLLFARVKCFSYTPMRTGVMAPGAACPCGLHLWREQDHEAALWGDRPGLQSSL